MKNINKWLEQQMVIMAEGKENAIKKGDKIMEFYYEGRIDQIKRVIMELED